MESCRSLTQTGLPSGSEFKSHVLLLISKTKTGTFFHISRNTSFHIQHGPKTAAALSTLLLNFTSEYAIIKVHNES
jgi:hypothetical protein